MLIGSEFGGLSIYATVVLSIALIVFEKLIPNVQPLVDTPFMSMIIGVGVTAIGIALTLNQNASTGGTDIVGKIFAYHDENDAQAIQLQEKLKITELPMLIEEVTGLSNQKLILEIEKVINHYKK